MKGDFGESLANTLIGQWTNQGQLFETVRIGGKWPTIDIYAELVSGGTQKMFCFFQVKCTELGYTQRKKRLKVQVPKDKLTNLANFNAPTYLIGVDYEKNNPPLSKCFIKVIRGNYTQGLSSMETTYVLNAANLTLLKDEVEAFWKGIDPLKSKATYNTSF